MRCSKGSFGDSATANKHISVVDALQKLYLLGRLHVAPSVNFRRAQDQNRSLRDVQSVRAQLDTHCSVALNLGIFRARQ